MAYQCFLPKNFCPKNILSENFFWPEICKDS
jgi:hypothetical protein